MVGRIHPVGVENVRSYASNLPIAINTPFHLKCRVNALGFVFFLHLGLVVFCCFFFYSTFDASLLPTFLFVKKEMHCVNLPQQVGSSQLLPVRCVALDAR